MSLENTLIWSIMLGFMLAAFFLYDYLKGDPLTEEQKKCDHDFWGGKNLPRKFLESRPKFLCKNGCGLKAYFSEDGWTRAP